MAIDAIIFDLDGTLTDTNGFHARAWRRAMERFGYGVGVDRLLREIGKSGKFMVPDVLGPQIEKDEGDALRSAHDELYLDLVAAEGVRVFPCAERLLQSATERGYKTAVATGSSKTALGAVMEASGFDVVNRVDVVVTATDIPSGKPGPEPVQAAARKLGVTPAQTVLVGDTPFDVSCARRAGSVCIGVGASAYSKEELLEAGARTAYSDVEDLGADFDAAIRVCSPGQLRLTDSVVDALMEEALGHARAALDEDNLPVGAVVADGDGQVVAGGFSRTESSRNFLAHAEMVAFTELVGKVDLRRRDLILVSTLEPCVMCYGAAMDARVETIIYGLEGPMNGGIGRCRPMRSPGMIAPRIVGGVRSVACKSLFEAWQARYPDTPFVEDLLSRI